MQQFIALVQNLLHDIETYKQSPAAAIQWAADQARVATDLGQLDPEICELCMLSEHDPDDLAKVIPALRALTLRLADLPFSPERLAGFKAMANELRARNSPGTIDESNFHEFVLGEFPEITKCVEDKLRSSFGVGPSVLAITSCLNHYVIECLRLEKNDGVIRFSSSIEALMSGGTDEIRSVVWTMLLENLQSACVREEMDFKSLEDKLGSLGQDACRELDAFWAKVPSMKKELERLQSDEPS